MTQQGELDLHLPPRGDTRRHEYGWTFWLTEREQMLLRKPITATSGGWQAAMREAATRIYPGGRWEVSPDLMRRLFKMCTRQGAHGGYQARLPMRVLAPVFASHSDELVGLWFYGKQEVGEPSRVKLGQTVQPRRRNTPYTTDNPRELVTLFELWDARGTFEGRVHRHFARYRAFPDTPGRREWFLCVPEVRLFLAICRRVSSTDAEEIPVVLRDQAS